MKTLANFSSKEIMETIIPSSLLGRLKEIVPGVESLIDETQSEHFVKNGKFDEFLFKNYLIGKKRASVYRRVMDKSKAIASGFVNDRQSAVLESVQSLSDLIWDDVSDLMNAEEQISSEVFKYSIEKNQRNIEGIRRSVSDAMNSYKQEIDDSLQLSLQEMEAAKSEAIYNLDSSDADKVRPVLDTQMHKFKQEEQRAASEWKRIVDEDLNVMLNAKIDKLDGSKDVVYDDLELTQDEVKQLTKKMAGVAGQSVINSRKLRRETANLSLSKITDISSSEGIIQKIRDTAELSESDKAFLEDIVRSDYLLDRDIELNLQNKRSPTKDRLRSIRQSLVVHVDDTRYKFRHIYESDIWKFCNGGWWAFMAHVATWGFCSGFTAAQAIAEALEGQYTRLWGLSKAVILVICVARFPMTWSYVINAASGRYVGVSLEFIDETPAGKFANKWLQAFEKAFLEFTHTPKLD